MEREVAADTVGLWQNTDQYGSISLNACWWIRRRTTKVGGSFTQQTWQWPRTRADLQGPTSLDVQTSRTRLLQLSGCTALKFHVRTVGNGIIHSESDLGIKAGGAGGGVANCSASQAVISRFWLRLRVSEGRKIVLECRCADCRPQLQKTSILRDGAAPLCFEAGDSAVPTNIKHA